MHPLRRRVVATGLLAWRPGSLGSYFSGRARWAENISLPHMKLRRSRSGISRVIVATLCVSSCRLITGGSEVEPGLIIFYRDTASITAPDTVAANSRFEVRFPTYAGGCTRHIVRTEVTTRDHLVEIRPYNRNSGGDVCTSDLLILEHRAETYFSVAGTSIIRVVGEQRGGSSGARNFAAQLERRIVVR